MRKQAKQATQQHCVVAPVTVAAPAAPAATPATLLLAYAAPQHTVAQPTTLRATRVQAVKQALYAMRNAAKRATHSALQASANHAAGMLALQQVAAQYGLTLPTMQTTGASVAHAPLAGGARTLFGSATNIAPKKAPSIAPGSCNKVHIIAAQCGYNRSLTLQQCALVGINPSTAATQFNLARKANIAALAAATPATH